MRTRFFMSLFLCPMLLCAQTTPEKPAPAAAAPSPEKVAEYQKRFEEGYALQKQGKLTDARAVYDKILAEEPGAKRSLLEAGRVSLKLNDWQKADDYLTKLHTLVPDFPEAYELLIQANQGLKRDVKVERLIREFTALRNSGKEPQFAQSLNFVREQTRMDNGDTVIFTQYFNYTEGPFLVWKAQVLDLKGGVKRQLVLAYDPKATKTLRAKGDPKLAEAEQFLLIEDVLQDKKIVRVDAYFQMFALPEYQKVRTTVLAVLTGIYKPVYTQAVEGTGSDR